MNRPSPLRGLLASAGWVVFGAFALPALLPTLPALRTAAAGAAVVLFVLALAAPRLAFVAALASASGLGAAALMFGAPEPASVLPAVLAGYLAGAALRDVYELETPAAPPMLSAFRAFAAGSGVSALAAIAAARTGYLLGRGVPPPRLVNGLGEDARGAVLGTLTAFGALVLMAGFHHAAARLAREPRGRRTVDVALVVAALVPGVAALAQKLGALPMWRAGRWQDWHRVQATFTDPSAAGVAIVLLLPALLACSGRGPGLLRGAAAFGAVLLLPLLADAGSRAGFLGTLLAGGLFLVWALTRFAAGASEGPRRRLALGIGTVTLFAVAAFTFALVWPRPGGGPSTLVSRLAHTFERRSTPSEGETGRIVLYETGLALFRDHPVAGVGLGAFRVRFPDAARALGRDVRWTDNPPSLYLGTLVESGISGGILLGILLTAVLRGVVAAFGLVREGVSAEDALRGAAAACSVVGLLLIFLFGSHLVYPEIAVLFGVVASRLPFPQDGTTRRLLVALVPVALAGAIVLLLGGLVARLWESRTPAAAFAFGDDAGVYRTERDAEGRPFRWTAPVFALHAGSEGSRQVSLPVRNGRPDRQPVALRIYWNDAPAGRVLLPAGGWRRLEVPVAGPGVLRVEVLPGFRPFRDPRRLGIAVGAS